METLDLFSPEGKRVLKLAAQVRAKRWWQHTTTKWLATVCLMGDIPLSVVTWALTTYYLGIIPGMTATAVVHWALSRVGHKRSAHLAHIYPDDPLAEALAIARRLAEAEDEREPIDKAAQLLLGAETEEEFMLLMEKLKALQNEAKKAADWEQKVASQRDTLVQGLEASGISDDTFLEFVKS